MASDPKFRTGQVNAAGKVICGAKKTTNGQPCQNTVVMKNGRCRKHGGKTPSGLASPHYKHGRYSKALPAPLLEKYNEAVNDPDLLNLSEEIALIDAMIAQVIEKIDQGESGTLWQRLRHANAELLKAQRAHDAGKMSYWLTQMTALIEEGATDQDHRQELVQHIHNRRVVVESEIKRREKMHNFVTREEQTHLVYALVRLVKEYVHDDTALANISAGLANLVAARVSIPTESGD